MSLIPFIFVEFSHDSARGSFLFAIAAPKFGGLPRLIVPLTVVEDTTAWISKLKHGFICVISRLIVPLTIVEDTSARTSKLKQVLFALSLA